MKFEDYCKEEFEKLNDKVDKNSDKIEALMMFMAVKKAEDTKVTKNTAIIVGGIVSMIISVGSEIIIRLLT